MRVGSAPVALPFRHQRGDPSVHRLPAFATQDGRAAGATPDGPASPTDGEDHSGEIRALTLLGDLGESVLTADAVILVGAPLRMQGTEPAGTRGRAMKPFTRRWFLVGSVGAAGMAAVASAPGMPATVARGGGLGTAREPVLNDDELEALTEPVLLQVRDAAAGEVELLVADRSVTFTDRALVAKVLRAAR